jgi:hypothetical protein
VNEPTIREYFRLYDQYTLSNYPIHFAGAALFLTADRRPLAANEAAVTHTFVVEESSDGTTWSVVLLSNHTNSGLLQGSVVGSSQAAYVFTSSAAYVRIRLLEESTQGVHIHLVQFPPRPREAGGYGS